MNDVIEYLVEKFKLVPNEFESEKILKEYQRTITFDEQEDKFKLRYTVAIY